MKQIYLLLVIINVATAIWCAATGYLIGVILMMVLAGSNAIFFIEERNRKHGKCFQCKYYYKPYSASIGGVCSRWHSRLQSDNDWCADFEKMERRTNENR